MDIEARVARMEQALWRERGRTQVLGRVMVGLLSDLKSKDPKLTDALLGEARNEVDRLIPEDGNVFRLMKEGASDTLDALRKSLALR